tara:strand:- start:1513 stop:1719 length:207 start_codon:yes stop_codon:yes gene_type:complete
MKKCIITKQTVTLEVTSEEEGWIGRLYKTYQRNELSDHDLKHAEEEGYKLVYEKNPPLPTLTDPFSNN